MEIVFAVCFGLMMIGALCVILRMVKGPHSADRILCLDLLAVFSAGFFAIFAAWTGEAVSVDATLATCMISFLSTILLARYLERRRI